MGASELSDEARAAAEAAAVAGERFDLDARRRGWRATTASPSCSSAGSCARTAPGRARVPPRAHAARRSTPTCRGCGAARCTASSPRRSRRRGGAGVEVAPHWLGARDERARPRGAAARGRRVAGRPRLPRRGRAGRQALELWPEGDDEPSGASRRSRRYARCAELAGELRRGGARVARALRGPRARGERAGVADAQRRLAAVYELQGRPRGGVRRAPGRRRRVRGRRPARPTPRSSGSRWPTTGASAPTTARRSSSRAPPAREAGARRAPRPARPRARARGRRARQARRLRRAGCETVRDGLALALEHDLTAVAAELYQRLSARALRLGRLPPRRGGARHRARPLPGRRPTPSTEVACVTCMVYVLRERGEWSRGERDVPRADRRRHAPSGSPRGCSARSTRFQGKLSSARRLLVASLATADARSATTT